MIRYKGRTKASKRITTFIASLNRQTLDFPLSAGATSHYAYPGHTCEGYRDGSKKAKSIRWQAQEEVQDRDPKDGSA